MNETENSEKNTRRMLLVVGSALVVALVVVGGVLYALFGSSTKQEPVVDKNGDNSASVSTADEIRQDIADLDKSIKQLGSDQDKAEVAIKDNKKQVKIGG